MRLIIFATGLALACTRGSSQSFWEFEDDSVSEKEAIEQYSSLWFKGHYALLKTHTGCPPTFPNVSSYVQIHEESSRERCAILNENKHIAQPLEYEEDGNCFLRLQFCESDEYGTLSTKTWPDGSYCMNKKPAKECPIGFSESWIGMDHEDSNTATDYEGNVVTVGHESEVPFCCTTSGSATEAIEIPTSTPFYLYRLGGQCQQVIGMDVTAEYVDIDTEDNDPFDRVVSTPSPDVDLTGGVGSAVRIYLCYYSPSASKKTEEIEN